MGQSSMGSMLARGGSILAASLLFLLGVYHFFAGIAGFARRNFYTVGDNYPYQTSSNGWGWIHVIGGVLLVLTSLALFSRSTMWARPVAIALCVASAIANFFFLAYFPLWAILMIALSVFCIWALVRDGSDQREQERLAMGGAYGMGTQQQYSQQTGMGTQQYGQQTGMGTQQQTGAQQREQVGASAYGSPQSGGSQQSGQRWPQNVGGTQQQQQAGRGWSATDKTKSASQLGDQSHQEHAQSGARSAGQAGRSAADQAADRARQSGSGKDYRSGR